MKLQELKIIRMPGITDPFTLTDIADGLTVVEGPNESGKTTICRAVSALLFGVDAGAADATATFEDGGGPLHVTVDRGAPQWDGGMPALPPPHLAACYTLRVDEMLTADNATDTDLAARLDVEMAGGYNIGAVRAATPKSTRPQDSANSARAAVEDARRKQEAAAAAELTIPMLDAERIALEDQIASGTDLQRALDLARLREQAEAIERDIAALPEPVRYLQAGDDVTVKELQRRGEDAAKARDSAERALARANDDIGRARLPDATLVTPAELQLIRGQGEALTAAEDRWKKAEDDAAAAQRTLEGVARRLRPHNVPDTQDPPEATIGDIQLAATAWSDWRRAAARATALGEVVEGLKVTETRPIEQLASGIAALTRWLAIPEAAPPAGPSPVALPAAIFAGIAAIVCVWVALQGATIAWAGAAVAAAAAVLVIVASKPRPAADTGEADRRAAGDEYTRLELGGVQWTREGVRNTLDALVKERGQACANQTVGDLRQSTARQRDVAATEAGNQQSTWDHVMRETGIDLTEPSAADACRVLLLIEYLTAQSALEHATTQATLERANVTKALDLARGRIAAIDPALAGSIRHGAEVTAAREDLEKRSQYHQTASDQATDAKRTICEAGATIEGIEEETRAFLEARQLETLAEFNATWPRYARYTELHGNRNAKEQAIAQAAAALANAPALAAMPVDEIKRRIQQIADHRARLSEIQTEVARIRAAADSERSGSALANAQANLAEAELKVRRAVMTSLRNLVAHELIDHVEKQRERNRPALMQRASDLFTEFTNGAYTLSIEPGAAGMVFVGRDARTGSAKRLTQLSGGTRMQLLLAGRLAFAESVERGSRLPVFLDETLRLADPRRHGLAVRTLLAMVREGRQVFYLTNDPGDTARIRDVFEREGAGDLIHAISLVDLRKLQAAAPHRIPEVPRPAEVPEPGSMTAAEYARAIAAPGFDPSVPEGSTHLLYALPDDLAVLRRVLQGGVETLGQWTGLSRLGATGLGLSAAEKSRVDAAADVARAFSAAWHAIAPRPLTQEIMAQMPLPENCGPGTLTLTIERAEQCGWNAADLISSLLANRPPAYRVKFTPALEAYLHETGCLVDAPLTIESVAAETLRRLEIAHPDPAAVRNLTEFLWACAQKQ